MWWIYSWIIRPRYSNIDRAIDLTLIRTTCRSREDAKAAKIRLENSLQAPVFHWAGAGLRRFHLSGLLFHGLVRNADPGRRIAGRDSATSCSRPRISGRSRDASAAHRRGVDRGGKKEGGGGTCCHARRAGASGEGKPAG